MTIRQGTPEWLEARRSLITGTAIPVLLGLSPYRCEQDLADEMSGGEPQAETTRMRIGKALEPLIAQEYSRETGRATRRWDALVRHPLIEWAAASPDYRTVDRHRAERRLVELKWSASRTRFADGLPQDVEAQVRWQLGCTGYPSADVAALVGDELRIFGVEHDEAVFAGLVDIAADFRRRLAEGGPFAQSAESLKRRYPADNGAEMVADADLAQAVAALLTVRDRRALLERDEEALENAIKSRMGEIASLVGPGFRISWKRTKDSETTDWKSLASGLLRELPEPERTALVGLHTTVRQGFRPFRVVTEGMDR